MHPITLSPITFFFLIFFSVDLTTSLSPNDTLPNCTQTFNCGPLQNISYPFTGGPRPAYCGPPGFLLTCPNDSPELTFESVTYRVLQLDQTHQNLTLARSDLSNTTCLHEFANSTLNFTIFSLSSDNDNLSLFYGCSSITTIKPYNQFDCEIDGNVGNSYYLIGPVPSDPILFVIKCNVSISVPILETAANRLTSNQSTLAEVLREGFSVNYSNPYSDHCAKCHHSGGECGFDSELGKPICICGDRLCPGSFSKPKRWLKIAIGTSAGVAGMIVISIIVIYGLRRECLSRITVFWKKETENDHDVEELIRYYGSLAPKRYTYSEIKKITNSFVDKLGQGGYGGVYKGMLPNGRFVAVKVLSVSKGNGEEFINEVASISRTSHVNIVALLGFCYKRTKRALIYELMVNGSLDKFIYFQGSSDTKPHLQWNTMYQIAVGIARGLEYLHRGCNTRILHFDIKPQNILLDENFHPKISDFGLAKLCKKEESIVSMLGARGTAGYIAPEVFCRSFGKVSYKSDVYSYGMMVLEMVGGRKNIDVGVSHTSEIYFPHWIYNHLEQGEDLRLHEVLTEEEEDITRKMIIVGLWCIQTNPADRPSMTKVVEMLEGSLQSLQIPPKPFLSSPARPPQHSSTISSTCIIETSLHEGIENRVTIDSQALG